MDYTKKITRAEKVFIIRQYWGDGKYRKWLMDYDYPSNDTRWTKDDSEAYRFDNPMTAKKIIQDFNLIEAEVYCMTLRIEEQLVEKENEEMKNNKGHYIIKKDWRSSTTISKFVRRVSTNFGVQYTTNVTAAMRFETCEEAEFFCFKYRLPTDAITIIFYEKEEDLNLVYRPADRDASILRIVNVIFNNPATIVFWNDGTKTVVKANGGDVYDPEKGIAMAVTKKIFGNKYDYYHEIAHWLKGAK